MLTPVITDILVNSTLAVIMLGVGMSLTGEDFRRLWQQPKGHEQYSLGAARAPTPTPKQHAIHANARAQAAQKSGHAPQARSSTCAAPVTAMKASPVGLQLTDSTGWPSKGSTSLDTQTQTLNQRQGWRQQNAEWRSRGAGARRIR